MFHRRHTNLAWVLCGAVIVSCGGDSDEAQRPKAATLSFVGESLNFYRLEIREDKTLEAELEASDGQGAVSIDNIAVEHQDPKVVEAFAIESTSTCASGTELAPGQRCKVVLRYNPLKTGVHDVELVAKWASAGPAQESRLKVEAEARLYCVH